MSLGQEQAPGWERAQHGVLRPCERFCPAPAMSCFPSKPQEPTTCLRGRLGADGGLWLSWAVVRIGQRRRGRPEARTRTPRGEAAQPMTMPRGLPRACCGSSPHSGTPRDESGWALLWRGAGRR